MNELKQIKYNRSVLQFKDVLDTMYVNEYMNNQFFYNKNILTVRIV